MTKKAVKKTGGVAEKKTLTSKPVSQDNNESRLLELVDSIYKSELLVAERRMIDFEQKVKIKKFESDAEVEVANDKGLKNQTARDALYNKLLDENDEYQTLKTEHSKLLHDILLQEAMLNKLNNEFSVRKLILRKEGKE